MARTPARRQGTLGGCRVLDASNGSVASFCAFFSRRLVYLHVLVAAAVTTIDDVKARVLEETAQPGVISSYISVTPTLADGGEHAIELLSPVEMALAKRPLCTVRILSRVFLHFPVILVY